MSANPDAGPSPFGTEEAERRLSELAGDRGRAVLFIVHAARGGTIRYAKTVAALIARDARVIFGRGIDNRTLLLCAVIVYEVIKRRNATATVRAAAAATRANALREVQAG